MYERLQNDKKGLLPVTFLQSITVLQKVRPERFNLPLRMIYGERRKVTLHVKVPLGRRRRRPQRGKECGWHYR